ncbi:pyruvate dehydrogenase complex dihydrolipoamide acetyltransferase [Phenylobacterium immobile]|uniref:pyruvate dehydrogenase complex dihydrolipoamide acetyltransferase n=1 Tax=Phenylobacterium immobile TaxID=21 RepID=UPI000A8A7696|nr:pyruvate dehydrogenase complex dihydrolipoamide acetyltransferase [Phenylobacterium immobile]
MVDILMPALSPTMEEGVLAKWHIKAGDKVRSGDVIAEIETDKATMDVEAVDDGVVEELLVPEGSQSVKVNTPIARLAGAGAAKAPEAKAPEAKVEVPPESKPAQAAKAEATPAAAAPAPVAAAAPTPAANGQRIFASPLARRIAKDKGLDLATLKGSGPHGRIVKADVENAKPGAAQPAPTGAASAPRQVLSLEQMGIPTGSYDLVPLDGMRKAIARRLTDSFRDVPHFPLNIDLEIDRLLEARKSINAYAGESGKVSVNDLVIKACAMALKKVPAANASYTPDGIAMHHNADIAMAVAIDGGLITPIIRSAESKSLIQIGAEARDLAERARSRKLKPEEFQGGTFSVSNLGMMGIKSFASIINEPQGCILSVGAGEKRPVVRGDKLEIATVMSVTLTCDHRVVDGAVGAQWLGAFRTFIEDPFTMLA